MICDLKWRGSDYKGLIFYLWLLCVLKLALRVKAKSVFASMGWNYAQARLVTGDATHGCLGGEPLGIFKKYIIRNN